VKPTVLFHHTSQQCSDGAQEKLEVRVTPLVSLVSRSPISTRRWQMCAR
jgi:hypothetical protein